MSTKEGIRKTFSPKQVAQAIGVSEASIKRWCDKGILRFEKTAGGHRRIPFDAAMTFIKENGVELALPTVLGLPSAVGQGKWTVDRARRQYREFLEQGEEAKCLRIALDLYLAGQNLATIGDQVLAAAFHDIGDRWQHGDVAVYQERRGVEIASRVIYRLKEALSTPSPAAPIAIGATLTDDPYALPGRLIELTLLEGGWRAQFYGCGLPAETICAALEQVRPRLLWLSVSSIESRDQFLTDYQKIYQLAAQMDIAVAVGGRTLTEGFRQQMQYTTYCDNLTNLQNFARALYVPPASNSIKDTPDDA